MIRILPSERPLDASPLVVSTSLPCLDFTGERFSVGQAPIQALAVKNANFDFRHVQPTGMLWRVVKDQSSQQFVRRFYSKHLLETLAEMGVDVVEHEMNATCRRVDLSLPVRGADLSLGTIQSTHDPGL